MGQAATGTMLAGRYRLEGVIGRGGMSTVYRASDQTLGRTVAVKVLLPALAEQDPTYSTRFEREARAAAALDNSSLVTVYDTGVDDDSQYIVMEYIPGHSLARILAGGRLEVPEAVRIATRVADALAAAHAAGILHRDIKPANVMLTEIGDVKVLDFGIARLLDGTAITQVASVVGTAGYMAPERALGQPGDARADIYSLGCLLYAMLTGGPPFSGDVSAAVLHQQINAEPRQPSALRPGIPTGLNGLVLAMLAKSPDARPATAAEVRDKLAGLADATSAAATTPLTAATTPLTAATTPLTAATTPLAGALAPAGRVPLLADHRRRAVVMALVTALVTLVAVALLSGGGTPRRSAGTTPHTTVTHTAPPTARQTTPTTPTAPAISAKPAKPAKPGKAAKPGPPGHGGAPPGKAKKHGGDGGD
jgi:serine/threonine-protein kinase